MADEFENKELEKIIERRAKAVEGWAEEHKNSEPESKKMPAIASRFRNLQNRSKRLTFRNWRAGQRSLRHWKRTQAGALRLVGQLYDRPSGRYRAIRRQYVPSNELPTLNINEQEVLRRFQLQKQLMLQQELARQNVLSANTKRILMEIARIQNLSKTSDAKMQRLRRERHILGRSMSILNTPDQFNRPETTLNVLSMENNILNAGNIFKENPENNILKKRNLSILNTAEAGNNLQF